MRAAIEMSLGFIITVIIAIVLLGLIITWLSGMIGGITDLTATMQQDAASKLHDIFSEQAAIHFSTYPTTYEVKWNSKISVTAGFRNDASPPQTYNFGIATVTVEAAPTEALKTTAKNWVTQPSPKQIPAGSEGTIPITITVPTTTNGIYIFRITPCTSAPTGTPGAGCPTGTSNLWDAPIDFTLTVKG